MVIAPRFSQASQFADDLCAVELDQKWGYIDPSGAIAIEPRWQIAFEFSEGLAAVCVSNNPEKWAYVDATGKVVVGPFACDYACAFASGVGRVQAGARWTYVDRAGKTISKG
jgi:hypothetical protein